MRISALFIAIIIVTAMQAQDTPLSSETYKTSFIGADLLAAPDAKSKIIGDIPEGVVLKPLAKESYWIKVKYGGKIGWVSSIGMDRIMSTPAADLDIVHQGYKIFSGKYRYFFGFTNRGVQPYTGELNVQLYAGDKKLSVSTTQVTFGGIPHSYTDGGGGPDGYRVYIKDVIPPGDGGAFIVETDDLATRYVFATVQGKKHGRIGKRLSE